MSAAPGDVGTRPAFAAARHSSAQLRQSSAVPGCDGTVGETDEKLLRPPGERSGAGEALGATCSGAFGVLAFTVRANLG